MKTRRQKLRNQADRLYQEYVLNNHKKCLLCGNVCEVGHHFIRKANCLATRYFKLNLIPLCQKCHCLIHTQPAIPNARILQIMGDKWFDKLLKKRKEIIRDNCKFYTDAINNL
jgi:5-methylcytosine-specific restriction endonuclease McrA